MVVMRLHLATLSLAVARSPDLRVTFFDVICEQEVNLFVYGGGGKGDPQFRWHAGGKSAGHIGPLGSLTPTVDLHTGKTLRSVGESDLRLLGRHSSGRPNVSTSSTEGTNVPHKFYGPTCFQPAGCLHVSLPRVFGCQVN